MKKLFVMVLVLVMSIFPVACRNTGDGTGQAQEPAELPASDEPLVESTNDLPEHEATVLPAEMAAMLKLRLVTGDIQLTATLYDNATTRDLLDMLPLTLTFEDYNRTEKIAYLTETLSIAGAPAGYDPALGDLALYAPWGNLVIYYRDFSYSGGLISLGHIDSGVEALAKMSGNFTMTLEAVK